MKIRAGKLVKRIDLSDGWIEVRENKRYRWMCFDKEVFQTLLNRHEPHEPTLGHMPVLLKSFGLLPKAKKVLIMGLGGGALIHTILHQKPQTKITAVEISKPVIELAQDYFFLDQFEDNLQLIHADINDFFRTSKIKFDILFVDMYLAGEMPEFYFDENFHQRIMKHMRAKGVAVFNLLCDDQEKFQSIVRLIRKVFDCQTLSIPVDDFDNIILFAFNFSEYKDAIYQLELNQELTNLQYDMEIGLIANLG